MAVLRAESFHELLHRRVNGVDAGNAQDEPLGQPAEVLAEHVAREPAEAGDQHQHDQRAQDIPEHLQASHRFRQVGIEDGAEGAADGDEEPREHHPRDGQRREQQQAGEEGVAQGGETGFGHTGRASLKRVKLQHVYRNRNAGRKRRFRSKASARCSARRIARFLTGTRSS